MDKNSNTTQALEPLPKVVVSEGLSALWWLYICKGQGPGTTLLTIIPPLANKGPGTYLVNEYFLSESKMTEWSMRKEYANAELREGGSPQSVSMCASVLLNCGLNKSDLSDPSQKKSPADYFKVSLREI